MGHNTRRWAWRTFYFTGLYIGFDPAHIWTRTPLYTLFLAAVAGIMELAQHTILEDDHG